LYICLFRVGFICHNILLFNCISFQKIQGKWQLYAPLPIATHATSGTLAGTSREVAKFMDRSVAARRELINFLAMMYSAAEERKGFAGCTNFFPEMSGKNVILATVNFLTNLASSYLSSF
jgi:hypothetical protein